MESNTVGAELASARKKVRDETSSSPTKERGLEAVEERLEKLEKANRRLIPLLAGLVLILALGAVKVFAAQDVIRANSLEIVDDAGKTRISLEMESFAGVPAAPALRMYDEKGNRRATPLWRADWTGLVLYDENGKMRAALGVHAAAPGLNLFDEGGKVIWQAPK